MRVLVATCLVAGLLAGCDDNRPNDQDQYFDNITPDPLALEEENRRLAAAESGVPVDTNTSQVVDGGTDVIATPVLTENAEISRTQDFKVVTEKETIASDAAKLAVLKEGYKIVEPEALPTRSNSVNIAAYAVSQKQAVGTRTYRRSGSGGSNCGRYRNDPDAGQRAFLKAGGPVKDSQRLDPDGDGFACDWNPDTYRRLVSN